MARTSQRTVYPALALLVAAIGIANAAPEARATCDVNLASGCLDGNCTVTVQGDCSGGNCEVNLQGHCHGDCPMNVAGTCSSGASCEANALSATCGGSCTVNAQRSQCHPTGKCLVTWNSHCETHGACLVSVSSWCGDDGYCGAGYESDCAGGRCAANVQGGCAGSCPLSFQSYCSSAHATRPGATPAARMAPAPFPALLP